MDSRIPKKHGLICLEKVYSKLDGCNLEIDLCLFKKYGIILVIYVDYAGKNPPDLHVVGLS